jgi:hypothetical protein
VHKSLLNVILHDQLREENAVSASLLGTPHRKPKPSKRRAASASKTEQLQA